jgi:transposase
MSERRKFTATLKAEVALAALKGDHTLAELSAQYEVHPNLITQWKRQLSTHATAAFTEKGSVRAESTHDKQLAKLYARIGQLEMERDFLKKTL